jgi:hypothetical protein
MPHAATAAARSSQDHRRRRRARRVQRQDLRARRARSRPTPGSLAAICCSPSGRGRHQAAARDLRGRREVRPWSDRRTARRRSALLSAEPRPVEERALAICSPMRSPPKCSSAFPWPFLARAVGEASCSSGPAGLMITVIRAMTERARHPGRSRPRRRGAPARGFPDPALEGERKAAGLSGQRGLEPDAAAGHRPAACAIRRASTRTSTAPCTT